MNLKKKLKKLIPPCLKCPYTLGTVTVIVSPCPQCRINGYDMYDRFLKKDILKIHTEGKQNLKGKL